MSNSEDDHIWAAYAKGVKKLGEKATDPIPPVSLPSLLSREEKRAPSQLVVPPPPVLPQRKELLDLRVERNLSLGDVVIEAKLDLHGKTEKEAFDLLLSFIPSQHAQGRRLLLVITGRGKDGQSVLKNNLPRWCDTPAFAPFVLAVRGAAPLHGGAGAYYLLLHKRGR